MCLNKSIGVSLAGARGPFILLYAIFPSSPPACSVLLILKMEVLGLSQTQHFYTSDVTSKLNTRKAAVLPDYLLSSEGLAKWTAVKEEKKMRFL